jgi:hypothetical protein
VTWQRDGVRACVRDKAGMIDSMRKCDLNHDKQIRFDEFILLIVPWYRQMAEKSCFRLVLFISHHIE